VKVAPFSAIVLMLAHTLPRCASIVLFDMNNSNPVPPVLDLATNFENSTECIPTHNQIHNSYFVIGKIWQLQHSWSYTGSGQ
jgi:hypothetical protein